MSGSVSADEFAPKIFTPASLSSSHSQCLNIHRAALSGASIHTHSSLCFMDLHHVLVTSALREGGRPVRGLLGLTPVGRRQLQVTQMEGHCRLQLPSDPAGWAERPLGEDARVES